MGVTTWEEAFKEEEDASSQYDGPTLRTADGGQVPIGSLTITDNRSNEVIECIQPVRTIEATIKVRPSND